MSTKVVVAPFAAAGLSGLALPATVILGILKVTGTIAWSWWAVLAPLIAAMGLYAMFLVGFAVILFLVAKD